MTDHVMDCAALVRRLTAGDLRAEDYVCSLLARCDRNSALNAFISLDGERALENARRLDQLRDQGGALGPLHGVPVAVKDNIDVAGMITTSGTPALAGNVARADAVVVARLRAAGAIVLGKANMHEMAGGITNTNLHYGTAHNPYSHAHVPGGSSGGTGVAVSAGLAPLGLGTDTGGSNRIPASFCGVVGFRPSTARWPAKGLQRISALRDTIGPMARTVADCALADQVSTGLPIAPVRPADLRGKRFGVPRAIFWADLDPEVAEAGEVLLGRLLDAGAILVEADLPEIEPLSDLANLPTAAGEAEALLSRYLSDAGTSLSAAEVFAQVAGPDVRGFVEHVRTVRPADFAAARDVHLPALRAIYRAYFRDHGVDAIVFPTSPLLPPPIGVPDLTRLGTVELPTLLAVVRNTNYASLAGIPGISLPIGVSRSGLPIGIEFDGPAGEDAALLALAAGVEAILPPMPPPPVL